MGDRRVVLDESERPTAAFGRGGRGGPRVYRFRLRQVLAVTGLSEAALWKALGRAGVDLDDFEALARWLMARAVRQAERDAAQRKPKRPGR